MRRQFPLFIAVIALACASGQTAGGAATPAERQKIVNLVPFDVANCFPSTLDVGKTANEYTLQAAFRGARPQIGECLADGRNQAPAGTKGKVTITLDGSGTTVTVTADGLQPAASSCIEKAIRSQLEGVSVPAGGKPITFEGPFERDPRDTVRLGVNESSDVIGNIRLAFPQWCNCFDGIKGRVPPELAGNIDIARADIAQYADRLKLADGGVRGTKPVIAALTSPDPAATQTVACLNDRISSMTFKISNEQLTVPAQFLLVNSGGAEAFSPTAAPLLQFAQLDAVRERRESEAFAALARRQQTANAYDAQVQAYQAAANSKDSKKRKSAGAMVKELKGGCAALVKADDEYTHALETELGVEQQAVTLAQGLKAKDPQWGEAEKASAAAVTDTQKQIDAAKQLRAANDKACPKEKF
jgi:hypothetical protein